MSDPVLTVVVPCFNEQESLGELHRRVSTVCASISENHEIVLVDDGSRDATWEKIAGIVGMDRHVRGVRLSRNFGHQLALSAGLSVARGDRILILDADLQDPPELLPAMMAQMDQGADVVYGKRISREGESVFKRLTAKLFYQIINKLSESDIPQDTGDFRLISRRVLDVLLAMPERDRFIRGMIAWIGYKQEPILYERSSRFAGQTKYPVRKMIRFAIDALTAFSIKPLQFASLIGFIFALVGALLVVFSLVSFIFFKSVAGWASIMAGISILSSVQLFVLGILGEYLGRTYDQVKGRPLFVISQISEGGGSGSVKGEMHVG